MPPAMVSPILYSMTKASATAAPLREKKSTNGLTTASAIVRGGRTTSGSGAGQGATMPTIIQSAGTRDQHGDAVAKDPGRRPGSALGRRQNVGAVGVSHHILAGGEKRDD